MTVEEMTPLMTLRSAGWLVKETDTYISLALDRCDDDGSFRDINHIPKSGVVKITRVEV